MNVLESKTAGSHRVLNPKAAVIVAVTAVVLLFGMRKLHDRQFGKTVDFLRQSACAALETKDYAKAIGILDQTYHSEKLLSDLYAIKNDSQLSFFHYKNYIVARDSIVNQENTKKILISEMESEYKRKTAIVAEKSKRNFQFVLFSIVGLVLLAGLIFVTYNRRQIKRRLTLQKEVAEYEQKALHLQMNPHFVFNCLNSINRFILVNQPDAASAYLTKFSRLIRLILDNSRSENVALDKEIDALRLYIDMEALRFNNRFTYTLTIDEDVALGHIEVPPMLLQPYVENAIWHGLMHLEGIGKLTIHVFNKGNALGVVIEDNGVGRAKAAELKSKSATEQKSHGLKITATRIDIINQLYNTKNEVFITDLFDTQGNACGTRVELLLH